MLGIGDVLNSLNSLKESFVEKIPSFWGRDKQEKDETRLESSTKKLNNKQVSTAYTLVVAIRYTKSDILYGLQKGDYISVENADKLYQLAKFLWLGSQQDFRSNFSNLFLPHYVGINPSEESEYDIYLLKIQIQEYDEGFATNAKSNRRFDAFQRLSKIGKLADVSRRLPAIACENKGFYQC